VSSSSIAASSSAGSGCTCPVGCSSLTTLVSGTAYNQASDLCLVTTDGSWSYININQTGIYINGIEQTSGWRNNPVLPAAIGGKYYVYLSSWHYFSCGDCSN
jgi:hypothetical protein